MYTIARKADNNPFRIANKPTRRTNTKIRDIKHESLHLRSKITMLIYIECDKQIFGAY